MVSCAQESTENNMVLIVGWNMGTGLPTVMDCMVILHGKSENYIRFFL